MKRIQIALNSSNWIIQFSIILIPREVPQLLVPKESTQLIEMSKKVNIVKL